MARGNGSARRAGSEAMIAGWLIELSQNRMSVIPFMVALALGNTVCCMGTILAVQYERPT